jgi:hypothetical protein
VIADERVRGRTITLGVGEHGLARAADAGAIVRALGASVADISDPSPLPKPPRRPGAAHRYVEGVASRRYPGLADGGRHPVRRRRGVGRPAEDKSGERLLPRWSWAI